MSDTATYVIERDLDCPRGMAYGLNTTHLVGGSMNRWNLTFMVGDYLRLRRWQLGREPGADEIRAINGFVEYVINREQAREGSDEADERARQGAD